LAIVLAALLLAFLAYSAHVSVTETAIRSITVDATSRTAEQFHAATGLTFMHIYVKRGNRPLYEHVGLLPRDRSEAWLERKGFSIIGVEHNKQMREMAISIIQMPAERDDALILTHPIKPDELFYYFPKTGLITCSGVDVWQGVEMPNR
jgi:hypothetical protein